jgi:hypothetical protein
MSESEDIPSDVMKAARQSIMAQVKPDVRWQYADGRCDHFAVVQACARAILAERLRCARSALDFFRGYDPHTHIAKEIGAAIRSPTGEAG